MTPASRPAQAGAWDFVTAQLLGGWGLPETGLSPVSHARLIWTHSHRYLTPTRAPATNPIAAPVSAEAGVFLWSGIGKDRLVLPRRGEQVGLLPGGEGGEALSRVNVRLE